MVSEDSDSPTIPQEVLQKIQLICQKFQDRLRAGDAVRIEDYLGNTKGIVRGELLRRLVLSEIAHRAEIGQSASRAEYLERFPDQAGVIDGIEFDAVTASPESGTPRS